MVFSCVLTSASLAGPQDYCALFAKDAAHRKTGQSEVITRTLDKSSSGSKANSARTRRATSRNAKIKNETKGGGQYQRSQVAKPKSEPQQLMGSSPPVEPNTSPGSSPQTPKCPRSGDPTCGGH